MSQFFTNLFNKSIDDVTAYSEKQIDILRLIRSENVGIRTFYSLIGLYGSAGSALCNIAEMSLRGGRAKPIKVCSRSDALEELEDLAKIGGYIVTHIDSSYPHLLLQIFDPPPVISCIGKKELLNSQTMAIVGSRNMSLNGKIFTAKISEQLAHLGFTIVSGLARGIDATAHTAALPNTIAVLAGGVGHIYPPENTGLYHKILEGGLLIAEARTNAVPLGQHFPQRNRLISGLSLGVLVVEAAVKSGSLITAKFALEQNREIFATPGFPGDPRSRGTNHLIKSGAHIVECIEDIITHLPLHKMPDNTTNQLSEQATGFSVVSTDALAITNNMRTELTNLMSAYPVTIEAIHQETGFSLQAIYTIILEMELAGKVSRDISNKVSLIVSC